MRGLSTQAQRAVAEEDELLYMQEQMRAMPEGRLAARVTRVARKGATTATSTPAVKTEDPNVHEHALPMSLLVGEVKERTGDVGTSPLPNPIHITQSSFPAVHHREVGGSRFARARRTTESSIAQQSLPASGPSGSDLTSHLPTPGPGSVEEESLAMLGKMSSEEVQEAQQELLQRLKPETLAFLRNRAKVKISSQEHADKKEKKSVVHTGGVSKVGNASKEVANRTTVPSSNDEASLPLAARLRFDSSGALVGLSPQNAAPSDAVRRTPLGGEGSMEVGLTLREACFLARSTSAAHRIAALSTLRAVLLCCRAADNLRLEEVFPLAEAVAEAGWSGLAQDGAVGLRDITRAQVYKEALTGARVVVALRHSLDDRNLQVMAAAAKALVVLVDLSDWEVLEACIESPLVGLPLVSMRNAHRLQGQASPWVTAPIQDPVQGGSIPIAEGSDDSQDWETLAMADPLSALLGMGIVNRVAYILGHAGVQPAAEIALLQILCRICVMGPDAAMLLARNAALLAALEKMLDGFHSEMLLKDDQPRLSDHSESLPSRKATPVVIRLLGLLCTVAPRTLPLLHEAGVLAWLAPAILLHERKPHLLQAHANVHSMSTDHEYSAFIWAMRIWQASAALPPGALTLLTLDDALPTLSPILLPEDDRTSYQEAYTGLWACMAVLGQRQRSLEHQPMKPAGQASGAVLQALQRQAIAWLLGLDTTIIMTKPDLLNATAAALVLVRSTVHADGSSLIVEEQSEETKKLAAASPPPALISLASSLVSLTADRLRLLATSNESVDNLDASNSSSLAERLTVASAMIASLELLTEAGPSSALPIEDMLSVISACTMALRDGSLRRGPAGSLSLDIDACILDAHQAWLVRCLSYLLPAASVRMTTTEEQCNRSTALIAQAADVALRSAAPGDDEHALRLLSVLCERRTADYLLGKGAGHISGGDSDDGVAAEETALGAYLLEEGTDSTKHGGITRLDNSEQSGQKQSRQLLQGLASSWLGLEMEVESPADVALVPEAGASLRGLAHAVARPALLPEGSLLPLPQGWLALCPQLISSSDASHKKPSRATLELTLPISLGLAIVEEEEEGRLTASPLQAWVSSAIETVFLSEAPDGQDPLWQRQGTRCLLARALCLLQQGKRAGLRFARRTARSLATSFAADSFGDRLYAVATSLIFQQNTPPDVQAEAFQILGESGVLHLLPVLGLCPAGPGLVLGSISAGGGPSNPFPDLTLCLSLLGNGQLDKSVQLETMGYSIVVHRLARAFDQESLQEAKVLGAAIRNRVQDRDVLVKIQRDLCAWDTSCGRPGEKVNEQRAQHVYA